MDNKDFLLIAGVMFLITLNIWIIYNELDAQHALSIGLADRIRDLEREKKKETEQ